MSDQVLSAVDFLSLAEQRRVARIDLADVGHKGIVFVCDLSTAKQRKIATKPKGKTRVYADKSMDIDWGSLPEGAESKMVIECLVTDAENGRLLEAAFDETEESYIVWPESELVTMYSVMRQTMNHSEIETKLASMGNAVTNLIVKTVRQISGTGEEAAEAEKKG